MGSNDMRGGRQSAKPDVGRPLDGRVSRHRLVLTVVFAEVLSQIEAIPWIPINRLAQKDKEVHQLVELFVKNMYNPSGTYDYQVGVHMYSSDS